MPTTLPLKGIKVLDLSKVLAGPWSTMTLGDLGAEIWKVEHPVRGDDTRAWTPPSKNGVSTYYMCANRNKQSLAVDMKTEAGQKIIRDLARKADIIVENFLPGSLKRMGLSYDDIKEINPNIVYCTISGYGMTGPEAGRPGYDFVLQAESGFMAITGQLDGPPTRLGVAFIDLVTGQNATQAILAALINRDRFGEGAHLDIALYDSALHLLANVASGYLNTGVDAKRYGNAHPTVVPYQLFDTKNGQIALAVGNDKQFKSMCLNVLKDEKLAADERFISNHNRSLNRLDLAEILATAFLGWETESLLDALNKAAVPVGQVRSVGEAFRAPTVAARNTVISSPHPDIGDIQTVRSPIRFAGDDTPEYTAPPMVGEHTQAILSTVLNMDTAEIETLNASGAIKVK
ncbi:CaiB/BaiF CoA-transferase family protein [Kordiimonas sp. SCSIO 12610]|uniref:CaiB/BaiF CoA transferase family protein n=1 Tax=Kordiimonas sp. SCSIO 12610 TaxID=2829597 RepID=UPI00210CD4DC|nr:CoA transferase [Kordiimonas sp. SCSIO 12610]UTW56333.1 CoA transferase [Kordiimonas sp. SCSIO 12610]